LLLCIYDCIKCLFITNLCQNNKVLVVFLCLVILFLGNTEDVDLHFVSAQWLTCNIIGMVHFLIPHAAATRSWTIFERLSGPFFLSWFLKYF
jgi:hypothetical protein